MSATIPVTHLEPGEPIERELPTDARHAYSLSLSADCYVRLSADQRGVDLALHVVDPDGRALASQDSPTGDRGEERIHLVTPNAGDYRIEVAFLEAGYGEDPGRYALQVEIRNPASSEDRLRTQAFRDMTEAASSFAQGRLTEARERFLAAAEAWQEVGEPKDLAAAHWWLGQVHSRLNELEAALDRLRLAERLFRNLENRPQLASVLTFQGRILLDLKRYEKALEAYREAAPLLQEINNQEAARHAWLGIGNACLWLDCAEEGMAAFETALDLLETFPDDGKEAAATFGLAQLYEERHDAETALTYYERAFQAAERAGDLRLRRKAQRRIASLLGKQGDVTGAEEKLQAHLEAIRKNDAAGTVEELLALSSLGSLHLDNGKPNKARPWLEQALELSETLGSVPHEAMTIQRLGRVHSALGNFERAREMHARAAKLFEAVPDRQGKVSARYSEARALYDMERFEEARELLENLLDDAETLRAASQSHELRASWVASRRHYWELLVETLMRLHEGAPEKRFDVLALRRSEEARARSLLDELHEARIGIRQDADEALLLRERKLRDQLNVVERQLGELLETQDVPASLPGELDAQRNELLRSLRTVQRKLRSEARQDQEDLLEPTPLRWSEARSTLLDSDTRLLMYFVGEERSFAWLASAGERDLVTGILPGRTEIERLVEAVRRMVTNRSADERAARRKALQAAGEALLGPITSKLDVPRLVIVPDGVLHKLPFAALGVPGQPDRKDLELLIDDHEVVLQPSISVAATLMRRTRDRQEIPKRVVVFADPIFSAEDERVRGRDGQTPLPPILLRSSRSLGVELSRLPETAKEARAAQEGASQRHLPCEVHWGLEASKSALLDGDLQGIRVLHFATHALLHPEHPELSGIVLSMVDEDGNARDGFVALHEIYGLDLDAELVVLSACETGLGRQMRGEGIIGLPRGFFYAGAPRVIHTLWSVDDRSTAELMSRFYGWHLGQGLSAAEALARAQRSMRAETKWSEPDHWAAFVFQGDWRPSPQDPTDPDDPIAKLAMPETEEEEPPPDDSVPVRMPEEEPSPTEPPMDRSLSAAVSEETEDLLYFTGLDATTGQYWTHPRTAEQLAEDVWTHAEPQLPPEDDDEVYDPKRVGLVGIDTRDLSQTGWGIIYPAGVSPKIERALSPLLELRRQQVGNSAYFHELYVDPDEYAPRWLAYADAGRGDVLRPGKVPYYLLMVGGPEELPFELQMKLGGSFAVGRIAFKSAEEYREYAERVVCSAERGGRLPREAVFFGPENPGDRATERTTRDLVQPLANHLEHQQSLFKIRRIVGEAAKKARLLDLLNGSETPAVLFTAGHGLAYPPGHSNQRERQGALVCSDLAGSFGEGPIQPDTFVAAEDLTDGQTPGLISFHFACYGVGTPTWDSFAKTPRRAIRRQAHQPFLSRLPQRLLTRPDGALAVVGHVDRAWTTSFSWEGQKSQPATFERTLELLFQGQPVGAALDPLRHLWNELAKESNDLWQKRERKELQPGDARRFTHYWTANNDARAFVICGDPAVTVAAKGMP